MLSILGKIYSFFSGNIFGNIFGMLILGFVNWLGSSWQKNLGRNVNNWLVTAVTGA